MGRLQSINNLYTLHQEKGKNLLELVLLVIRTRPAICRFRDHCTTVPGSLHQGDELRGMQLAVGQPRGVPSMLDSWEVKVFYPTRWR